MGYYRKKPVVIEAVQINAADFNGRDWDGSPFNEIAPEWLVEALRSRALYEDTPNCTDYAEWKIKTPEGVMCAGPDDWIIRGVNGELYAIKDAIFKDTYELAPDSITADALEEIVRRATLDLATYHGSRASLVICKAIMVAHQLGKQEAK